MAIMTWFPREVLSVASDGTTNFCHYTRILCMHVYMFILIHQFLSPDYLLETQKNREETESGHLLDVYIMPVMFCCLTF